MEEVGEGLARQGFDVEVWIASFEEGFDPGFGYREGGASAVCWTGTGCAGEVEETG